MPCAARSKPCSPRSRDFMAPSTTNRRSASIASVPRRASAGETLRDGRVGKQLLLRSLRRDAHLGGGGTHVAVDVLFVFDEILLEHAHELARGFVERRFVLPGLHRVEKMRLDSG